jgi:hypothetical protein
VTVLPGDDADKLERDLRALVPVVVALADREHWPREVLVNKLVRLVMRCVRSGVPDPVWGGVCDHPACGRPRAAGVRWCCGSCQLAAAAGYQVPDTPSLGHTERCEHRKASAVTHRCPPGDSGTMPCCGLTPFEVPASDRISEDQRMVTCGGTA